MDVEKWIAALPVFVTVIAGVSAAILRISSAHARRLDRVAQLSLVLRDMKDEEKRVRQVYVAERSALLDVLTDRPSSLSNTSRSLIVIMIIGTLAVIASSVIASSEVALAHGWATAALILFVSGAGFAVAGVIGGFISDDK